MKILIVDDIPANLRLLRAVLEVNQWEVVEARNGAEGMAALEVEPFSAIISDILMPKMDGYRFCEEVRRDARFRHLPFIVYTSTFLSPTDEKLALDMGADKYLRKPAPAQDILDALNEVIARGPLDRAFPLPPEIELDRSRLYNDTLVNKLDEKRRQISEKDVYLDASEDKFRRLAQTINEVLWTGPAEAAPSADSPPPSASPIL